MERHLQVSETGRSGSSSIGPARIEAEMLLYL